MLDADIARRRWRGSQLITFALLAVWFGVTFGVAYGARALGGQVAGWPLSFWVAAQGAPVVYVLLVALYARLAHRLDDAFGAAEAD